MIYGLGNAFSGFSIDLRIYSESEKIENKNISILDLNKVYNKSQDELRKSLSEANIKLLKRLGVIECKTCKNRKYQDVSDDPGVSFKTPQSISPQFATSAVLAHESEHIKRETERAKEKGKEVIQSSISLSLSICPECGRVYVSGGKAKVVTRDSKIKDPFLDMYNNTILNNFGMFFDKVI